MLPQTNIIPDTTVVTASFYLKPYIEEDIREYFRSIEDLTSDLGSFIFNKLCYMEIFCDKWTYPEIYKLRSEEYNLHNFTKYHILEIEDLWAYQYKDKIIENRKKFFGSTCIKGKHYLTEILTNNKFDFLEKSIKENYFNTKNFIWVDCNLQKIFNPNAWYNVIELNKKYSLEVRDQKFLNILHNIPKKFHIQILGFESKKYLSSDNKFEFYQKYRYITCGGMFSLSIHEDFKERNLFLLQELKNNFIRLNNQGFGHGEEMIFFDVIYNNFDDFSKSYGDYYSLIYNYNSITEDHNYILNYIIKKYLNLKAYKECYEACIACLKSFENNDIIINWNMYLNLLFYKYVSSFYYKREEAKENAELILHYVNIIPAFKKEFDLSKDFYLKQLSYVLN